MRSLLLLALATAPTLADDHGKPPVRAPFEGVDTLCVNDWWNRKPSEIVDLRVPRDEVVAFALYTVADNTLKLTAQLYPLYPKESRTVVLEVERDGEWVKVGEQSVNDLGWCTTFRVSHWGTKRDVAYRVSHLDGSAYEGTIRRDPADKPEIVVASLSCNSNKDRGMRPNYVRNINHQDPDLVFFAGDQSYDHKQHTAAWLKFGLQFREVFRHRPCVTIPDDHDIGQGNLWGERGKKATTHAGDDGGYFYHPEYVRMVERAQCGHLPDPYDPTPIEQGIGVYYTSLKIGGVDFAILEDRKFKSGPNGKIPKMGPRPDHINDPAYDRAAIDLPGLKLLGDRQLAFLEEWGQQPGAKMRCVLSQTGFAGACHLHGGGDDVKNRLLADLDSNGWPQTGRLKAVRLIKAAGAVHLAGDQHISTLLQHGIDGYRDGPWAFLSPAIHNSYYSRWWRPLGEVAGANRSPDNPLPWTGDYEDGFGNKLTMHAYANPDSPSHGSGYGLVRFHTDRNEVTFECWPRETDATQPGAKQFTGWPKTVKISR
ncbi:PhoD-like phosphatase [Planctomycetes bacterium MalM25]|nr:PhoD-like phosphatase [Planctomycetes bacterium MalM25]